MYNLLARQGKTGGEEEGRKTRKERRSSDVDPSRLLCTWCYLDRGNVFKLHGGFDIEVALERKEKGNWTKKMDVSVF